MWFDMFWYGLICFDIFWCGLIWFDMCWDGLIYVDIFWYVSIWFYISDKLWYVLTSVEMFNMYGLMCFETFLCADIFWYVLCFDMLRGLDLCLFQASDFVQDNRLQRGHQSGEPQGLKSSILHIHQGAGDPHNSVSLLRCGQPRSVETMEAEGPSLTESQVMFWTQSWPSEVNSGMLAGLTGLDGDWSCFTLEAGRRRRLRLVRLTGISLRLCRCNMGQRESHKTFLPPLLITAVRLCIWLIWLTGCCPNAPGAVGHGYQQDQE